MALNHITIMGRLVKEPDLRHTQSGTAVASYTVAVDRDYQSGGSEKQTDFINCISWKGGAEFVSKWFHKGDMIAVDGRLQTRQYEDKNGNKRTAVEVVSNNLYFGGSKKSEGGVNVQPEFNELDDSEDELPF